jgi:hypothetical protein
MRAIPNNTEVKFKRYDKDSFSITKIHIAWQQKTPPKSRGFSIQF